MPTLAESDTPTIYPIRRGHATEAMVPVAANEDTEPSRPRSRRWLWVGLAVLALLVIGFVASRMFAKAPPPPAIALIPQVTVVIPGRVAVADAITATGSIAARRDSSVGVQGEGGMVTQVLVEPGQSVAAGQVLARIDRRVQTQTAVSLGASIQSAQADAALAQSELTRAQALVSKGFISKADIDRKTATRDGANAKVAVARAQLAEAQARTARLDIRAPAAGLVLSRNVETGQVVGPSSAALFRIAEGGVLEMRALVAEQDMARLKAGLPASVTPVGSTTVYHGRIWLLDPVIDPNSRQGIARIALAYSPGLRVGAFANADIAAGEAFHPVLPQSAVQIDDKGSYVFVAGSDDKVRRVGVTVGTASDAGIAILTGLQGNERVVQSSAAFLEPGEKIKPVLAKGQ